MKPIQKGLMLLKKVKEYADKNPNIEIGIFCWVELEQYWNTLYELNKTIQNKKLEMKIPVPEIKVSH